MQYEYEFPRSLIYRKRISVFVELPARLLLKYYLLLDLPLNNRPAIGACHRSVLRPVAAAGAIVGGVVGFCGFVAHHFR